MNSSLLRSWLLGPPTVRPAAAPAPPIAPMDGEPATNGAKVPSLLNARPLMAAFGDEMMPSNDPLIECVFA